MQYKVHFLPADVSVMCDEGKTIMEAERIAGLGFEYPCGGNGTCGKCMVSVFDGKETKVLKSCTTQVCSDITVTFLSETGKHDEKVLTSSGVCGAEQNVCVNSGIKVIKVDVDEAQVGDTRTDFERFCDACKAQHSLDNITYNSVSTLSSLSETFAKDIFTVNAVFYENVLLDIRTDDVNPIGLAYDIGTTTIACYLLDLTNGDTLATIGALNEQVKYGGDVVSRCIFAMENSLDEIQGCVNDQVNKMAESVLKESGKSACDVYAVSIVGNTCMHHIFAGISPISLVNVPYTPAVNGAMTLNAADYLKTATNKNAKLLLLPVIAGFIGADTVSAILATDFADKEKTTLLLDIGTNGEMALGNRDRWVSCSTASGPAFEGAKITCGMRGAPGAVDHVWMENGELKYSTIDNKKPVGICGSGLMDVISVMLAEEVIIPSGRFNRKYEEGQPLFSRIVNLDEIGKAFIIAPAEDTENGNPVFISQKDVREVQLAKGAIAAGIEIMADAIGVTYDDINEVLIAGAFGNYMKPESMGAIKLIPPELVSRIVPVGNAAGNGAKMCVLNTCDYEKSNYIACKSEFIELATHEHFQPKFIAQLDF